MASGEFIPEIALMHPEALRNIHKDFQHAGSDVIQAFTYNGHREKMRVIGKEHLLEPLNRAALQIAKQVSIEVENEQEPNLLAGNISNSNIWDPTIKILMKKFNPCLKKWFNGQKKKVPIILLEKTFYYAHEAYTALEEIKKSGLPSVITISPMGEDIMRDGISVVDTCKELEQRGADVVGMNCFRGPSTMMPFLKEIRKAIKCHIAALPITFRTTKNQPTFFNLDDNNNCTCPSPHGRTFPTALDPLYCNRYEIRKFAEEAHSLGIKYLGVCCGAAPIHIREVAEAIGREVPASRYREKMTNHFMYGTNERIPQHIKGYGDKA